MANFVFKETKQTSMKVAGIIDSDNMIIYTDDEPRKLATLLSAFNGAQIDLQIKVKEKRELDEPLDFIDDEEE